jgi:DNA repair photolyase
MKVIKIKTKNIFTKTKLPGCDFVINQYVGCGHGCLYCYANAICKWLFRMKKQKIGRWGKWVVAKINAPELAKGKKIKGSVWMSSLSDPYQPIERKLKLTRKILENMDKNTELAVQTKSDLILRDINLFKKFKKIEIGLTINGFEGKIKKLFEPNSSTHKERLKTLKILKENGLKTYAFISPIIPYLVNVKKCIKETKKFADYYWFEILNLKASGKEFQGILKREFPRNYRIMIDKERFWRFVKSLKEIIKKENIKTPGIVIHYPVFKIIKVK